MRGQAVIDTLVDLLIETVHHIGARAEHRVEQDLLDDLKRVGGEQALLYRIADAAVERPDGTVREVLYPVVVSCRGAGFPPGWVHLPDGLNAERVKQLVAETLVTVRDRRGFARQEWQKVRPNEQLDLAVYARAALSVLGSERYGERFWKRVAEVFPVKQEETDVPVIAPAEVQPGEPQAMPVAAKPAGRPRVSPPPMLIRRPPRHGGRRGFQGCRPGWAVGGMKPPGSRIDAGWLSPQAAGYFPSRTLYIGDERVGAYGGRFGNSLATDDSGYGIRGHSGLRRHSADNHEKQRCGRTARYSASC